MSPETQTAPVGAAAEVGRALPPLPSVEGRTAEADWRDSSAELPRLLNEADCTREIERKQGSAVTGERPRTVIHSTVIGTDTP